MRVGSARIEGKGSYQGSNGLMRNLDRQMYRMEFDPFLSLDPFLPGFGCLQAGSFPFTFSILEAPRFFPRKEHVLFKTSFFLYGVYILNKSHVYSIYSQILLEFFSPGHISKRMLWLFSLWALLGYSIS